MNAAVAALAALFAAHGFAQTRDVPAKALPVPDTVSPQIRKLIGTPLSRTYTQIPATNEEWKKQSGGVEAATAKGLPALRDALKVKVEPTTLDGVKAFIVTPETIPPQNRNRLLVHVHGGCFASFAGESGTVEAIYMAGFGGFKVISVDYRTPPDHPYPPPLATAMTPWQAATQMANPKNMAIFGSSAGGKFTLPTVRRATRDGQPPPAPTAPGTPR